MTTQLYRDALAAMLPEDVQFILRHLPPAKLVDAEATIPTVDAQSAMSDPDAVIDNQNARRRHIERDWPAVGVILTAEYFGTQYQAEIIVASKRLKSGKQIRIASGPSRGAICDSFSEAMLAATEMQRATDNLGRKGVSNGWLFWDWPGKPENIAGDPAGDPDMD